ncbi:MAG TPA: hypothetical protein VEB63_02025 [Chitinophagaceae bacterium]|nr:hypothetical protein [Chitinophagaceae bacterium]
MSRLFRIILWVQAVYFLLTAVWGLVHIESFVRVTGYKTDIWLVKTVSVLILAVGISLLCSLVTGQFGIPVIALALFSALGLAVIDFYYSGKEVIRWVYAVDGILETGFALTWIVCLIRLNRKH